MPGELFYADTIERTLNSKLGEMVSVLDVSPTAGKGTVDEAPVFSKAYASKIAKGGGVVYVPGAVGAGYRFNLPLNLTGTVPIEFVGEGRASKIFRGAAMPAGKGMIDLTGAKSITFRRLFFDGAVTASAAFDYAAFGSDPAHPLLTTNSMFWLHGAEDITFIDCDFEHTGGYSHYLDARAAKVKGIRFINCRWRNNRPHTIGTGADLSFGSPTGGILYQNQGTGGNRVEDLTVRGCRFARGTGRGVWGHGYGYDTLHTRIHVDHNTFEDYGLNAVIPGNTIGGSVIGNSFRRIGYICSDDTAPSVPKWHPGNKPAAIGGYGVTKLVPYTGNAFVSINGAAINADGYCYGAISGNVIRVPRAGEPEYTEDLIASSGAGQGIILANGADREGASGVTITGNSCDNLSGTAIGLYSARRCYASANLIVVVTTAPAGAPIVIGGLGGGSNQNATDNLVTENMIHYSPATKQAAIVEDDQFRAFTPTDANSVVKNRIIGNEWVFEFKRAPLSNSNTGLHFTTNTSTDTQSRHGIQREGQASDSSSALRVYVQDGGAFGYLHMQLQAYRAIGARGPLLNVSESGPGIVDDEGNPEVRDGVISTGPSVNSPYGNAMITGMVHATGYMAFSDATFWDGRADLLPGPPEADGWALLRWDHLLNRWRQSVEGGGAAGPRIWTDFAAGGGTAGNPAGTNGQVQFNENGAFGASPTFTFTGGPNPKVNVTTTQYYPAIEVYNGYVLSGEGVGFNMMDEPWPADAGRVRLYAGMDGQMYISSNEGPYVPFSAGTPAGSDSQVQFNKDGKFGASGNFVWDEAGQEIAIQTKINTVGLTVFNGFIQAAQGYGISMTAEPPVSEANQVRIYAGVDGTIFKSSNTQAYGPFGNPDGSDSQIQFNRAGNFGASGNLVWDDLGQEIAIQTKPNTVGLTVFNGFIQAAQGYGYTMIDGSTAQPAKSEFGQVRLYADTNGWMYISTNGGDYGPVVNGPAGNDTWIQYNKDGVFWASEHFIYNETIQTMTVDGGVALETLTFTQLTASAGPPPQPPRAPTGKVRMYADTNGLMYISTSTQPYRPLGLSPAGGDGDIQFNDKGAFGANSVFYWNNTLVQLFVATKSDVGGAFDRAGISVSGGWVQSEGGFLTLNAAPTAIQAPSGGVQGAIVNASKYISVTQTPSLAPLADDSLAGKAFLWASSVEISGVPAHYAALSTFVGSESVLCGLAVGTLIAADRVIGYKGIEFVQQATAPPVSTDGRVRVYAKTDGQLWISTNGAAYGPMSLTAAGTTREIQYNKNGAFAASANLIWDEGGILALNGYLQTQAVNNSVQWVMYRTFAPPHVYYVGIDAGENWFLMDATRGGYQSLLVTPVPLASAGPPAVYKPEEVIVASCGWFRGSGGLGFMQMGAEPARSLGGQVRIYANTNNTLYISTNGQPYGPFGGGGTTLPAGPDTSVQYNVGGTAFGGSLDLKWEASGKTLNIGGGSNDTGCRLQTNSTGQVRNPADGSLGPNSVAGDTHWMMHRPWIYIWYMGINTAGRWFVRDAMHSSAGLPNGPDVLTVSGGDINGAGAVVYTPGWFQSIQGFLATGTAYSALDARNGGALVQTLSFARVNTGVTAAPPVSGSSGNGEVKLYANTNGSLYISTAGSAWAVFGAGGGGSGTPGGGNTDIQFNKAGVFGGDGDLSWTAGNPQLGDGGTLDVWSRVRISRSFGNAWQITSQADQYTPNKRQFWIRDETNNTTCLQIVPNVTESAVLVYTAGYFESANGYNGAGYGYDAFRAANGGVFTNSLRAKVYTQIGTYYGSSGPLLTGGDSTQNGCMYHDDSTYTIKVRVGGNWRTVQTY